MKVIIKRASGPWTIEPDQPPVDGARVETVWVTDSCGFASFHAYDTSSPKIRPWTSVGRNHRETGGGITRELAEEHWVIEIDDLWAFSAMVGHQLVIGTDGGFPTVQIYDDYLE